MSDVRFRAAVNPQRLLNAQGQTFANPIGSLVPENPANTPLEACVDAAYACTANQMILTRLRSVTADLDVEALVAYVGNHASTVDINVGLGIYEFGLVDQGFVLGLVDYGWVKTPYNGFAESDLSVVRLSAKPRIDMTKRYMLGLVTDLAPTANAVVKFVPGNIPADGALRDVIAAIAPVTVGSAFPVRLEQTASHQDVISAGLGFQSAWVMAVSRQAFDVGDALSTASNRRVFLY